MVAIANREKRKICRSGRRPRISCVFQRGYRSELGGLHQRANRSRVADLCIAATGTDYGVFLGNGCVPETYLVYQAYRSEAAALTKSLLAVGAAALRRIIAARTGSTIPTTQDPATAEKESSPPASAPGSPGRAYPVRQTGIRLHTNRCYPTTQSATL